MATWIEEEGEIPEEYTGIQSQEEQQQDQYEVENYRAYLNQNPDVDNWNPSDIEFEDWVAKAQYHYDTFGKNEGRVMPTTSYTLNGTPNWQEYLNQNPDVKKVYGSTDEDAQRHWTEYGAHEGRILPVNEYAKTTYYQRYYSKPTSAIEWSADQIANAKNYFAGNPSVEDIYNTAVSLNLNENELSSLYAKATGADEQKTLESLQNYLKTNDLSLGPGYFSTVGERGTSSTPGQLTGKYYRFSSTPNAEAVQKSQFIVQKQKEMQQQCSNYRGAQYNACMELVNQKLAQFSGKALSGYAQGGVVESQKTQGNIMMNRNMYPRGYAEGGMPMNDMPMMQEESVPSLMDNPDLTMPTEEEITEQANANKLMGLLEPEELDLISVVVEQYPELLPILDKIDMAIGATEFEGEGPVAGPGTETSDSIPAKLSDGEFVFTAKAVKQIGVDKLRKMMSKAEDEYDVAMSKQDAMSAEGFAMGGLLDSLANQKQTPSLNTQPINSATASFMMPQQQTVPQNLTGMGTQAPQDQQGIMAPKTVDLQQKARQEVVQQTRPEANINRNSMQSVAPSAVPANKEEEPKQSLMMA